ncbi:MAG: sodium-translocating pyrophosphatase [Candidatus Margulisbacteria bacterium]|nr:sodium-translocating pyrophosphatase [Candidatus Margulisiibacteriota bacterium]MBU1021556.1 sodium-translocating pyrophosphatase [Candidatus Margulisiibacteriota bacterium]MBU1728707.1 sodium-translocating pyrophosphatase [Candidatus Margulisiibacteriota bacterium]MBU1955158.1 sodium-translocating pyrophosphatase [Candidatus Margulisiibacteriota bacterium]
MNLILIATLTGAIGIIFIVYLAAKVMKEDPGNETMVEISEAIHTGAMAFLKREYKAIAIFVVVLTVVLFFGINWQTSVAYLVGAVCSLSAGYLGMKIATRANTRTAHGATKSFNHALEIAFSGGAVMGMYVVSIGLFALSLLYFIFYQSFGLGLATSLIAGFSMGASSVALFARVGGGIYTKAADVGADLVGKVEAGIPEDDPRNPAVIADLVGDNVGDVAGMGADLYESYVGAIIAGIVIAVATLPTPAAKVKGVVFCLLLAAIGIVASIIGTFFVRTGKNMNPQKSLRNGTIASATLFIIAALLLSTLWYGSINPFWAILFGLISGLVMGYVAEYFTSGKQVVKIAESAQTGPATVIIAGIATGMKSTVLPLVVIGITILVSYHFVGMFGVALAALGMLSIAGMTVSVDAYGPIADNAGGIAEMSHLGPEIRKITDSLDAAGNTTAAIAKGFAIGSAALTALALFSAYTQVAGMTVIDIMQPRVIAGLFVGGVIPFLFTTQTMQAVGRAAFLVVGEVRRQFKEIKGLMENQAKADYARCVDITTQAALKEMIAPGLAAVLIPLLVGIAFGPEALAGLLAGVLITGVPMAIFLANAGGAWDNAKKYIEEGHFGGKKSPEHAATVIGDTVGDPFKDTAGPAINILIKLITVVSLVFAPLIIFLNQYVAAFISRFIG